MLVVYPIIYKVFVTPQEFHQPYQPPQALAGGKTKKPVQPRLRGHQRCRIDRAKPWGNFGWKKNDPKIKNWVDWYTHLKTNTLQGINISHLGKRKIIFKMPFLGNMLVSWRVYPLKNDGWFRCISYWNSPFFIGDTLGFWGDNWPNFIQSSPT